MEWWTRLIEEPLYVGAGAAALALLLLLWLVRRRRSASGAEKRPEGLWQIIAAYKDSHPSFYFILEAFQANHAVDQLCHDREVMEAFHRLDRLRSIRKTAPAGRGSSIQLLAPERDEALRAPQAPMTKILRGIYSEERYARDLPPQAEEELDRFLDSLTG